MKRPRLQSKPPCPRCGSVRVVGHSKNPAGGRKLLCRACGRTFIHGGPGLSRTSGHIASAFVRLVFDEGRSIRSAAREVGIAKGTGRSIYWRVRELRQMEAIGA